MTRSSRDNLEALSRLLNEGLDLGPEARSAWLAEQRKANPTLAAEVEALLSREPELDQEGFLSPASAPQLPEGAGSLVGHTIGAYRLERQLGQGGMGTVWRATRIDGRFEGSVAIKFLSLAVAGPVGEARFHREGSVLARLTHPNIARLLDAGVTPSGQHYLVLELVEGQRLDLWCDERRLPAEARLRLFQQVLAAVAHAHANLIVHRDLKPSNILVTTDGTVKLLDFGIAKLLEPETGGLGGLTASHDRLLTYQYAAPEQVKGEPITTATDVYALGVVLYQLLVGRHPTSDETEPPAEQLRAVLDTNPPPLSRVVAPTGAVARTEALRLADARATTPERLRRVYAGDLENILAKALRKDQAERYPTVTALADDLDRFLRHEPVAARPDAWSYRAGKFLRRHRGAASAAVLVALALLGAAIVTTLQAREARRQRDAALYQSARADAQVEFQSLLMSSVGDRPLTMREILDQGRGLLERQYGEDPELLGTLLIQLAGQYGGLGDVKLQAALLARAESLALAGHGAGRLAEIRCDQVDNLRSQGSYDEARRLLDRTDSLVRVSSDPEDQAFCLSVRADLEQEAGNADSGRVAIERAIAIRERLGKTRDMFYLNLLSSLGNVLAAQGRSREAQPVFRRALAGMDSSGRGGMASRGIIEHDLALTFIDLGETAEAERLLHDALVRSTRTSPTGEPHVQPLVHYAETALFQGQPDSARKYFGMIVAQAVRDTNLYWEGRGLFGRARGEIALGALAEARRSLARFREIRAIYPHVQDTDDVLPDISTLQGLLALAAGDTAAAHDSLVHALRSNGYFEDPRPPKPGSSGAFVSRHKVQLRPVVILVAETALSQGRIGEALELARTARDIGTVDSLADRQSAYVGEARLIEGRALLAQGDTQQARAVLGQARSGLETGAGLAHPRTRQAGALLARILPHPQAP
ncbi:MAG: serine/threonine-protein kinase [Gemmatimonadales bacterium]